MSGWEELGQKSPIDQRCEESEVDISGHVYNAQTLHVTHEEDRTSYRLDQIQNRQHEGVHIKRLFG